MHRSPLRSLLRWWAAWVVAAALPSCSRDTGVFVDLSASEPISQFTLSAADPGGVLASETFDGKKLPGTVFVQLPAQTLAVRLAAGSVGTPVLRGFATAQLASGEQPHVALQLGTSAADSDSDGWPDPVDDCPAVADPDQRSCSGNDGGTDGGTDGGEDAGPPCSVVGTYEYCEDFEDGAFDENSFGNGTATFDTTHAARGTHSLRIDRTPTGAYSGENVALPVNDHPMFVRYFLWLPSEAPPFATLVTVQDTNTNELIDLGLAGDGGFPSALESYSNYPGGNSTQAKVSWPRDRWSCVELGLHDGDGGTAPVQLWLDGQLVSLAVTGGLHFDRVLVGGTFDVNEGGTLYIDEVVTGPSRLGCGP
ncbi:MAG: hypothetical protein QM723_10145 [Myxococcaceae bacterium]